MQFSNFKMGNCTYFGQKMYNFRIYTFCLIENLIIAISKGQNPALDLVGMRDLSYLNIF